MVPTLSQLIERLAHSTSLSEDLAAVAEEFGVTVEWLEMVLATDAMGGGGDNQAGSGGIESAVDQPLFAPPGWAP